MNIKQILIELKDILLVKEKATSTQTYKDNIPDDYTKCLYQLDIKKSKIKRKYDIRSNYNLKA